MMVGRGSTGIILHTHEIAFKLYRGICHTDKNKFRQTNEYAKMLHLILMCHCRSPEPPIPERRTSVKKKQDTF